MTTKTELEIDKLLKDWEFSTSEYDNAVLKQQIQALVDAAVVEARLDEANLAYSQIINRSSLRVNNHLLKRIAALSKRQHG